MVRQAAAAATLGTHTRTPEAIFNSATIETRSSKASPPKKLTPSRRRASACG